MITPIHVDFAFDVIAICVGFYYLWRHMGVFSKSIHSPSIESAIIGVFILLFSIWGFKASSIIYDYPAWLADSNKWSGAWSYAFARLLALCVFVAVCCRFARCARYQRAARQIEKE